MFQQINNNALDIFPIQIQTLNAPLPNSFVLETEDFPGAKLRKNH